MVAVTKDYTEKDRRNDFHYLLDNSESLFQKYGRCYLAIRKGEIIGHADTPAMILKELSGEFPAGTYSIQECDNNDLANRVRIQRLLMRA